ncbi:MAG: hypothetical protein H7239_09210 [Flavobacterium sp.]|nr:hypothetical protein [Flavobacterium sp.]
MKTAIPILQNIILSELEKDSKFEIQKTNAIFWTNITVDLLRFEQDAKPVYALIYSLELDNPEKIISKLTTFFETFIKALAENYVLGETSEATDYLLQSNNETFGKEVAFLKTLQQAVKSVERKRIKSYLPKSYERLTFEISDTDFENATIKKGREDLREKFKQWNSELVEESTPVISIANGQKNKIISLSWLKYAVAACVVLATGLFFFKYTNQAIVPNENTIVKTDNKNDTLNPEKNITIENGISIAAITIVSENTIVQQSEAMGFSSEKKLKITITVKDATSRIKSLEKYIAANTKETTTLNNYKKELIDLEKTIDNYEFDGKLLKLFSKFNFKQDAVLVTDDQNYYLKKENFYYVLKSENKTMQLTKVSDNKILEVLKKISFENE